jgi:putative ABC transport system permease protein
VRSGILLDQLALDIRYSVRALKNAPAFTAVAVLSLALGIGANTAIFSVVNALMLKLLPVSDPARLVSLYNDKTARGRTSDPASYYTNPIWEQIRDHQNALEGVAAYSSDTFDGGSGGEVQRISGLYVSGRYFDVAGVRPWIGRMFTPDDDRRGGGANGPVAVLSYDYWRQRYQASPDAVGSTVRLGGQPFTIIGVTPPGFFGLQVGSTFDVAVPLGTRPVLRGQGDRSLDCRSCWWMLVVGRLKPGQTIEQASTAMRAMQPAIREATLPPNQTLAEHFTDPVAFSPAATGISEMRTEYRSGLFILMAIVGTVLLIACANLANLLLARAAARRKEFAVRLAIGASRGRLVRQLLIEGAMLAVMGALVGLAFARSASDVIVRSLSSSRTRVFVDVAIDGHVLAFTVGVAMATVALFGMVPAFRSTDVSANDVLKSGGRGIASGGTHIGLGWSLEKLLVAAQLALSLVLVFGASLFVRSFATLTTLDPGFNASHVMQVATSIGRAGYAPEQRLSVYERLKAALGATPGVQSVAYAQITPVRGDMWNNFVQVDGFTPKDRRDGLLLMNSVSTGYFRTLETTFYAGRDFDEHDTVNAPRVVIVNEAAVRKFFHGESPVGRVVKQERPDHSWEPLTVVGVVRDTAYQSLRETPPPLLYFSMGQNERLGNGLTFLLRTQGDTASLASAVARAGSAIDKNITFELRGLDTQLRDSLIQERLLAMLSGFFGLLALLVAAVGLYGMMSLAVTRRRSELGLRMALGADARGIVRLVLRDVAMITAAGLIAGAAAALASGRIVSTLLFGLTPTDPTTCALAMALLAGVALLAGYLPARRAARLDPMVALREE